MFLGRRFIGGGMGMGGWCFGGGGMVVQGTGVGVEGAGVRDLGF